MKIVYSTGESLLNKGMDAYYNLHPALRLQADLTADKSIAKIIKRWLNSSTIQTFLADASPAPADSKIATLKQVIDYLGAALRKDKLPKIHRLTKHALFTQPLDDLIQRATTCQQWQAAQPVTGLAAGDYQIVHSWPDGWRLLALDNLPAINAELERLGNHAIPSPVYERQLKPGGQKFYALRAADNLPRAIMSVGDNKLLTCFGTNDKPASKDDLPYVARAILMQGWQTNHIFITHIGFATDRAGIKHALCALPAVFNGNLEFANTADLDLTHIKIIDGDLNFTHCNDLTLKRLRQVTGDIKFFNCSGIAMNNLRTAEKNLNFSFSARNDLKRLTLVKGNLDFHESFHIRLAALQTVTGSLNFCDSWHVSLPRLKTITGSTHLSRSTNIHVNGVLKNS